MESYLPGADPHGLESRLPGLDVQRQVFVEQLCVFTTGLQTALVFVCDNVYSFQVVDENVLKSHYYSLCAVPVKNVRPRTSFSFKKYY